MSETMRRGGGPLWHWISVRMIGLALAAMMLVGTGMWFRYFWWLDQLRASIPDPVRQELQVLEMNRDGNEARLRQIYGEYLFGDYFTPEALRADILWFSGLVLIALPLIVGGGIWLSRRLSHQLGAVAVSADRIAQGDFSARATIVSHTPSALRNLADDFNRMAERLERNEQELQASSAAIAHELNTPLTAAKGRLQGLIDGVFAPTQQNLDLIMRQLDQLNRLIDDLYLLSLATAGELALSPAEFALRSLLEERVFWAAPRLQAQNMRIEIDAAADLHVRADRDRLGQMLSILIDNATRYAATGGWLALRANWRDGQTIIEVEDAGPGFIPEHMDRVCDRFWRADHSRSRHAGGSGLGLSVAVAICKAHGGQLTVHNRRGGGARIRIQLPG